MKCIICGKQIEKKLHPVTGEVYWDTGNNAEPVNSGRCCDGCNDTVVIPRRIRDMQLRTKK